MRYRMWRRKAHLRRGQKRRSREQKTRVGVCAWVVCEGRGAEGGEAE